MPEKYSSYEKVDYTENDLDFFVWVASSEDKKCSILI